MSASEIEAGGWRIRPLLDGRFRLDGGAMWGVVPAVLWRKLTPPDEDNTIDLALRAFLAERDGYKVIVEPGIGDRWDAKSRAMYRIASGGLLESALGQLGLDADEITHVVATHGHWDHIGAQVVERDGRLVPLFQRARHFAPAIEIERARHSAHARRASYRWEDFAAIEAAGLLESYSGKAELLPGLEVFEIGGHSPGVSLVGFQLEQPGSGALFWSDVVPTTHHVQPAYIMAYDVDPQTSYDVRSHWIARAAEAAWIGLFYHDAEHAFARIERDAKRYRCVPL